MTTQPKTTEAENPYLTREDALAILNTPDDQLDELIAIFPEKKAPIVVNPNQFFKKFHPHM